MSPADGALGAPAGGRSAEGPALGVLAGYALISLMFFGLPVIEHFRSTAIALNDIDPGAFMWFLAWWPHALTHGLNPFFSHAIFVPDGYNLTWVTSIPGPSLLLAPVTLAFGPVAAYNVLSLLAPALSGWTAYLLCRHITGARWPSLAGGYVFGFSPFMLGALQGAPNVAHVELLPIFVLLVLRHLEGALSARRFSVLFGLAIVAQFSISVETVAMTTVFGAVALVLAYLLYEQRRAALAGAGRAIALAYLGAAVALGPFLYYMAFRPHTRPTHAVPATYSSDLLSFVFPTKLQALGDHAFAPLSHTYDPGAGFGGSGYAYVGVALAVVVASFAAGRWRQRPARLVTVMLALTALASLGPRLHIAGVATVPLPWAAVSHLPLLRYALPARFPGFMFLCVALALAMWLARRPGLTRWALALASLALLLPHLGAGLWKTPAGAPSFFADGVYKGQLTRDDRVLVVPNYGGAERWQAETGMAFGLAGGYLGEAPADYASIGAVAGSTVRYDATSVAALRRLVTENGVTAVIVDKRYPGPWRRLFGTLGVLPKDTGGVLLYRLR